MVFWLYVERVLLTLWVGALWAVGYLAAPVLFFDQGDRMLAGMLAGHMFTLVAYIGLVCGGVLLAGALARGNHIGRGNLRIPALVVMLILVAVGQFVIEPQMAALKVGGLVDGTAKMTHFMRLHGIASSLYLLNSLIGLALVAVGVRPAARVRE